MNFNIVKPKTQSVSLEELYLYLRKFSLSDSLYVIGLINASLRFGLKELVEEEIPPPIIVWIKRYFSSTDQKRKLLLETTKLARFLILSGANDFKENHIDVNTPHLAKALNLTGELFDRDIEREWESDLDIATTMGRMAQQQFPLQMTVRHIIGRAILLFLDIPSELNPKYNLDEKMREYFGIGSYEFIISGYALWMLSKGVLKEQIRMEIPSLKGIVTDKSIDTFIQLSVGTRIEYCKCLRKEDWKISTRIAPENKLIDIHGLDPFLKIPAIKVERSKFLKNGSFVVPQPYFLLQRASSGIFHLLSDKEREIALEHGQPHRNDFRQSFGDSIYRAYVKKHLLKSKEPITFVDLDEDFIHQEKQPDFALIANGICILFEVKTGLLTVDSRSYFVQDSIRSEILSGNIKKALIQLNTFEKNLLDGQIKDKRFENISTVMKVIVGYEDIYIANSIILPLLREVHAEGADRFQIATISDVEMIGNILSNRLDFCELFQQKVDSEKIDWPLAGVFRDYIIGEHETLTQAFDNFFDRILSKSNNGG